jgi:hypothetical protein
MKIPVCEQPLDESLSLVELIHILNTDRAVLRATRLEPSISLKWSDIAGQDENGRLQFWRDIPVEQRPEGKRHIV